MKTTAAEILARRYAQACINVFGRELSLDDFYALRNMERYLKEHSQLNFFLQLSIFDDQMKQEKLDEICQKFNLGKPIHKLIELLVNDKRPFLLAQVIHELINLYKKYNHIYDFQFISVQELTQDEQQVLHDFLAQQTGFAIIYECVVNKKLIAGIRLQSDTLLWEHSIRKQLHAVELQIIR